MKQLSLKIGQVFLVLFLCVFSNIHRKNGPTNCILSIRNNHILIPSKTNGIEKYCILCAKNFPVPIEQSCSFSLLSNFRVKLARKRFLRRLLECCPTIPSMISCIVHHSRVSLIFSRSPSPNAGDSPSRGPSPLYSHESTGRESSLSTRKEKVLITCVGILYSPIIMQSVEGQACPDATHFLMAGTQVCDTTVYAHTDVTYIFHLGVVCALFYYSHNAATTTTSKTTSWNN